MEVLYPEVIFSLDPRADSRLELQNGTLKDIRGTNFKDGQALLFSDHHDRQWLWKDISFTCLIHEIFVSFLANELEICIPKSLIGKKGHSIGLIQEWIMDAVELSHYNGEQPNIRNKEDILDLIVFMAWIGATDRHSSNYIYSNGKLFAVDFEDSFSTEIHGTELLLYFPWIKEKKLLHDSLLRIRAKIKEKDILSRTNNFFSVISLKEDVRARKSLNEHIAKICLLLNENYHNLEKIVIEFIERSISPILSLDLF